jgi:uroporphyrinogen decarboxylase
LSATSSRFVRACLRQPVDRTPVWFLRQAGRYMPEYMAVRKHHSLLEICRTPEIASEVTITAAERLGVDAAIIFADLLLPLTPMGLDFEFIANEGPVIQNPLRTLEQIQALRTDRSDELIYVARAIEKVAAHFNTGAKAPAAETGSATLLETISDPLTSAVLATDIDPFSPGLTESGFIPVAAPIPAAAQDQLGIIGFCGAPFTLASYMIEGGSSRNYIETKKLMYASAPGLRPTAPGPATAWPLLMSKLIDVLAAFCAQQVEAGADVIQIFDSWAGALSVADYRDFVLGPTTELVRRVQALGVPVIYFGVDTASLLPTMRSTGADVLGLDWRIPLDQARRTLGPHVAVQGNLDPIALFASPDLIATRVHEILAHNNGQPGHIFNLGHGIVPGTPVESVLHVVDLIKASARHQQTT